MSGPIPNHGVNALIEPLILVAEILKKKGNNSILVVRTRKVVREAAGGEGSSDLGKLTGRAADASDEGTCKTYVVVVVSKLWMHLRTIWKDGRVDKTSDIQAAGNVGWNWTLPEPSLAKQPP